MQDGSGEIVYRFEILKSGHLDSHEEINIVFINHFCIGTFNDNHLQSYN
jgi:hypothetical protein